MTPENQDRANFRKAVLTSLFSFVALGIIFVWKFLPA